MAYLGEAKRNKYSFAHANDLILTEETQELYETTLDGGHIVHTSDVWAETVDYVADSTDADTFVTANPTIVHKYTLQNLTEVAGSNGQVWKIVDTGVWIKNWVNPAKQADTDGSAGVGWQAKLYQDDDTEVTPSEGRFWISYKTGTIHFEAGYTPSDRGYGTPKTTCYNYIGDMASAVIADDKVKVDTAATPDYIGAAYSDGVIRTDDATIGVTDGGNFITLAVKTDGINDTHINWGAGANQVDCDDLPIKQIGTPTWTTQCHYNQMFGSAGRATGGLITDATSANINVAGGTGFIKATDDDDVALLSFDWSASNGIAIPTGTTRYIGVEYGDPPVVVVKETNTWDYDTDFPLGVVVNNADTLYILNNPWWVTDSITNLLERADCITGHVSRDICVGGLMIGDSADTNQYITMTAGKLWSRFNEFTISEIDTDPGGGGDDYVRAYRDAGTGYTYVTGQTTWDNAYWDDGTGTLNTLDSNKYGNLWLYLVTGGHIIVAYGWGQYTNSASAELEAPPTTVPPEVEEAGILLGRFIVQEGTTNAIAVDSAFTTQFTATQAADHSNLTGLAWTTAGHTATASTLAGFDGAGDAAEYTESNYSLVDGTRAFTGNVTIQGDLIIEDAGYIGSASDVDAIQIEADGDVVFSQDITVQSDIFLTDGHKIGITGSEPQLTFNSTDHDFEFKYGTVEILGSYPLRWRDLGDTVTYGYIRAISTDFTIESNVPMDIDMMDNSATALVISEGANAYATFSSLNGTESIVFAKTVTVPDGSLMATSAAPTTDAMIANKKYVDDHPVGAHTHDGDTLQLDAVNSDGGAFAFNTGGTVTFNEAITMSAGKDLTIAGHILFNTNNSYIGFTSPRITFNDTDDQLDLTGTLVHANQSYMLEQAGAAANKDGYGQLWVKTATPNELWFTDDGGTSIQLNVAAGGTDVKVAVDAAATADYLGAAFSDGVLRADGTILTWTDGGDFATLGWASTGVGTTTWGSGSALTWTFDASAGTDTTVAFGDDTITVTAADFKTDGNLWLNGSNQELRFYEGANYVGFEAPALAADQIWVLPTADGDANELLQTNGSGTLDWWTIPTGSFGVTPPGDGFNGDGLTTDANGTGITASWTWNRLTTHGSGRSWLVAHIVDKDPDPTADDICTETLWRHIPIDFASWDTSNACDVDSWAAVTNWGNNAGWLEVKFYDTAGNLDYTMTKTTWGGASTWETTAVTAANLNGTYTPGEEFYIEISARRVGSTWIGGMPAPTPTELRIGEIIWKYNRV